MTSPDPDRLAEDELAFCEDWLRNLAAGMRRPRVVMQEYDRRGRVEKAAATYVTACLCNGGVPELADTISAAFADLCAAVRTNGDFRG